MAIGIGNTSSGAVSSPSGPPFQLSWSHTVGSGSDRILIAAIGSRGNQPTTDITGVTYSGQSMSQAVGTYFEAGGFRAANEIWYLLNPPVGTASIVVTFTATADPDKVQQAGGGAVNITGAAQQAPEATNSTTYGSGGVFSSMSTSITTVTDNAIIIDGGGCDGSATVSSFGSGQTAFVNANQDSALLYSGSYEIFATAGATSQTQTLSTSCNRGAHCVAVFAETGAPTAASGFLWHNF